MVRSVGAHGDVSASGPALELLFHEPGARWRAVAWGPAVCLLGAGVELARGLAVHTLGWLGASVVLVAVTALQVVGARRHTSVQLTAERLRQGPEVLSLSEVVEVLAPDPEGRAGWQLGRALGESPTVPRTRTGIGLRLHDGRTVQAWAVDDADLRAALLAATGLA